MYQERFVFEAVTPQVDCGRFAVKAVVGDRIDVAADIWRDGHDLLKAVVLWRKLDPGELELFAPARRPDLTRAGWRESRLSSRYETNDRWFGALTVDEVGAWAYTIAAWTDVFGSWLEELAKKVEAGQRVASELLEGTGVVERTLDSARDPNQKKQLSAALARIRAAKTEAKRIELLRATELAALMERNDPRLDLETLSIELPLWVDRQRARFGSWYEVFPRSMGTDPSHGATLREAEARLPAIGEMGFDVLYLPPIHPIGRTHRKGPNNVERGNPGDPGSPWAIGNEAGGHDAVSPDLGTLADFDHFREAARAAGMEIALDFAVQCSPDHPWVREHPQWFSKRPDGSIKYAENPPKKYQDIYPLDFQTDDRQGLYEALLDLMRFWIEHGVKIFRVDNPHTKPNSFWEWLITTIHRDYPDVLFLAEAFTRPKRLQRIAKLGFSQSYTYFTWRNTRQELEEYARELFCSDLTRYLRPNLFTNTPDILHAYLQKGGRPAFIARLVLAGTLSPSFGIYSGFELCENRALREGSEEYLDSEKYQLKVWDWDRPGHIVPLVRQVNQARRENPALQLLDNLRILPSTNPSIIAYAKATPNGENVVIVVVNLDPFSVREGTVEVPLELARSARFGVTDLLTGARYHWVSGMNYVRLDPEAVPAHLLRLER
jgi:starch synthase (maltosyl-transferring)